MQSGNTAEITSATGKQERSMKPSRDGFLRASGNLGLAVNVSALVNVTVVMGTNSRAGI